MQATETADLVIGKFRIENFCRVEVFEHDARGQHVVLSGPNGSGKTSVLDALWLTLRAKGKAVAEPVHHGAGQAVATIELLDRDTGAVRYIVRREWAAGDTKLVVRAGDGHLVRRAAELVDRLLDEFSLDLSKFLTASKREQLQTFLRACKIEPPVAEVEEILGERIDARPGEDAFGYLDGIAGDGAGIIYDRRKQLSVQLRAKQAALAEAQARCPQFGADDAGDVATADDLLALIDELQKAADSRRLAMETAKAKRDRYNGGLKKQDGLKTDITARTKEILRLTEERDNLVGQAAELAKELRAYLPQVEDAEAAAATIADPAPKISEARAKLRTVEEGRKQAAAKKAAVESAQTLDREVQELRSQHGRVDLALTRLRELPKEILERAEHGINGLSVSGGELRLNGAPLAQASQAEKIRVACALAFRRDASLKVARIDDAEHLDQQSWQMLVSEANRYGWRLLAAFVRDSGELKAELVESGQRSAFSCQPESGVRG